MCSLYLKWFGLVYLGLTPQQQPGSYRGSDYDDVSFTGGGNRSTWQKTNKHT